MFQHEHARDGRAEEGKMTFRRSSISYGVAKGRASWMDGLLAGSTRVSSSDIDEITMYGKGLEYITP